MNFLVLMPLVLSLCSGLPTSTIRTPHTLRKIPLSIVKPHLPPFTTDPSNHLFEIAPARQLLIGPNNYRLSIRLHQSAPNPAFSYNLNNQVQSPISSRVYLRHGDGFSLLFNISNNRILAFWSKDLHLKPLHHDIYPNVFVHTRDSPTQTKSYEGDMVPKPVFTSNTPPTLTATFVPDPNSSSLPESIVSRQSGTCASGTQHVVEVAVAYDNTFCALYSNDEDVASAYVQAATNLASGFIQADTCVRIALVHLEAHCNDPSDPYEPLGQFTGGQSTSIEILSELRDIWESSRTEVNRDLAIFFSGFNDGTSTIGAAFVSGICGSFSYSWIERGDVSTLVHETGHSLSATHTAEGVMMASSSQGDPIFFSTFSVNEIETYIDTFGDNGSPTIQDDTTCLDTTAPVCDSTCPGSCINGQCVALYSASASSSQLPCSPIVGLYRCVDTDNSLQFGTDCPSPFTFLQRSGAGPDVFCCNAPSSTLQTDVITTEFPFVRLIFNESVSREEFIRPELAGAIETGTLLETSIVSDCSGGTGTAPPPTVTTIAATTTASGLTTAPTTAALSTTTTTSGGSGKCISAFGPSETFVCSRGSGSSSIPLPRALVTYTVEQNSGLVSVTLRASSSIRFTEFRGLITTDPGLGEEDVSPRTVLPSTEREVSEATDVFALSVPSGASGCCGQLLFVYLNIAVCETRGNGCASGLLTLRSTMLCDDPCGGGAGSIEPFSASLTCPVCQL